jgi:hypothetical protein
MSAAHRPLAALLVSLLVSPLVSLGMTGCGSKSEAPSEPTQEPMPVKDSAFGDMVGTMDKARAVEDTTMQHKKEIDRVLDTDSDAAENAH